MSLHDFTHKLFVVSEEHENILTKHVQTQKDLLVLKPFLFELHFQMVSHIKFFDICEIGQNLNSLDTEAKIELLF